MFTPNSEQILSLFKIASKMKENGLTDYLVDNFVKSSYEYEGIYDLMTIWDEEDDLKEKDETLADLEELLQEIKEK